MTLSKRLFYLVAPLCFTVACATSLEADDAADTATTSAALSQPGARTAGDSCTLYLPAGWSSNTAQCRSGGTGTQTIVDGDDRTLYSVGGRLYGTGQCTVTCNNGHLEQSDCSCSKGGGGGEP